MPELQLLRPGHAPAILAFELANREYFAASISDRGDEFFEHFAEQHSELIAEQAAGVRASYVLVDEDGSVLGRFNLSQIKDGRAELGYRVAERAAGRGVATSAVVELCRLAPSRHGIRTLRAATSRQNVASQRVLLKAGFVEVGPADPAEIGGKTGNWYERELTPLQASRLPPVLSVVSWRSRLSSRPMAWRSTTNWAAPPGGYPVSCPGKAGCRRGIWEPGAAMTEAGAAARVRRRFRRGPDRRLNDHDQKP